jgi:phosphoglycerate dehydrogenase-like enzyme
VALRIATLGTIRNAIPAQSRFWDFAWEHIDADKPAADGRPHEADVLLSMSYRRADTERVTFRLLHALGAGLDKIDFDVVPPTAWVCNMFGHEVPMAEYCISAMLNSCIDWAGMRDSFRGRSWGQAYSSRVRRPELAGKTIGIVGFGHIGQEVAKRARGFDTRILAVASRAKPAPEGVEWIKGPEGVEALAAQSDFIVLSAPLTDETRGIIGAREIAAMKPDAYLINVGRGGLADEQALFDALRDRRIRGAALDAWYAYPASADDAVKASTLPFADLPNVVATPHSSAWTAELAERRHRFLADNLRRFIAGEPMQNVVRPPLAAAAGN